MLACVVAGAVLTARAVEVTNHVGVVAAAFSPYLIFGALLVAGVLFIACRRWLLTAVVAVLTVATFAVQLRTTAAAAGPADDHVDVRVMSANLFEGGGDAHSVVEWAREHADVVALQEVTPEELERLSAAGIDAEFPHRVVAPKEGATGAGLWSRYPIEQILTADSSRPAAISARVSVPGLSTPTSFAVVHTPAPWPWPIDGWRDAMAGLKQTLKQLAQTAGDGAVVVAGDFNSTPDMLQFRRLLTDGYQDAEAQNGIGFAPTYPADSWLPPLIAIDHVLTRNATASSVYTATIPGSDHRALMSTVSIPVGATD